MTTLVEHGSASTPAPETEPGRLRALLVLLCAALAMVIAANSSLSLALPQIATELRAGQADLTWVIDGDAFSDGDEIVVSVNTMTLYTGSFVTSGQWWNDPVPSARVSLVATDVGAGAGE